MFSPSSSLQGKPIQSAGWDCSSPVGYFFAKVQVTISFPSSNIVMSNCCFLSTLGEIEKFLYTWRCIKRCARRRKIFKPHHSPGCILSEQTFWPMEFMFLSICELFPNTLCLQQKAESFSLSSRFRDTQIYSVASCNCILKCFRHSWETGGSNLGRTNCISKNQIWRDALRLWNRTDL